MAKRLVIGNLNPGDTFRFRGDDLNNRWEVIEPPKSYRRYLSQTDRVFCVPTIKNAAHDGNAVKCFLYPVEVLVLDVRRSKK